MDWFLYDNGLRHERVKGSFFYILSTFISISLTPKIRRKKDYTDEDFCKFI